MIRTMLLVTVVALAGGCSTPIAVGARAGYTAVRVGGGVAFGDAQGGAVSADDRVDVEHELGLDGAGAPTIALDVAASQLSLRAAALWFRDAGEGVLESPFGQIARGVPVESELSFANIQLAATWDLVDGPLQIAPGIGIEWFVVDTTVASITPLQIVETVRVRAPVPMLCVDASYDFGVLRPRLSVAGMEADVGDARGTFWDLDAALEVRPLDAVQFFAGYRAWWIAAHGTVDGQQFDADLQLGGWSIGGGVRF